MPFSRRVNAGEPIFRESRRQAKTRPPETELEKLKLEKQNRLLTLGAGMASVAAIVGGSVFMIGGASASAADNDGSQTAVASVAALAGPGGADHAAEQAAYITALAAKLGISESQLTDALKSVQLDHIAKAVTDGTITQAQADALTTRINSGDAPLFGFGGGPGHDGGPRGGAFRVDDEALATFLGLDDAALHTALQSGKSLATVASDNGKSRDELKAFMSSELMTSLNNAVADGKLTQAEADAKLADATAKLDARIDHVGPVDGGRHGRPGMTPPAADGSSSNGSTPPTPSTASPAGA